jgi:hypothetical protein
MRGDHQVSGRRRREPPDLTGCDRVAADLNTAVEHVEEAVVCRREVLFECGVRLERQVDHRGGNPVVRWGGRGPRGPAVEHRFGTREANDGHCVSADDLELRLESSIPRRECDPQLENAYSSADLYVFIVDDAATRAHPNRIAWREVAHVAIVERTLKDHRHGLEASVGMRPADAATRFEVEAIIYEQDEGIAQVKCRGLNDLDGRVAPADAPRCGKRGRVYA